MTVDQLEDWMYADEYNLWQVFYQVEAIERAGGEGEAVAASPQPEKKVETDTAKIAAWFNEHH